MDTHEFPLLPEPEKQSLNESHSAHHSVSQLSDTPSASPEPAVGRLLPRPVPPPLRTLVETSDQTDSFLFPPLPSLAKRSLPSPRTARSQSLAHSLAPIKRKPLSSTASPLATRYSETSTREFLDIVQQFPRPEQRFSRSCSLDSPTLYEFPDQRSLVAAGLLSAGSSRPSSEASPPRSSPVSQAFVLPQFAVAANTGDFKLRNIEGSNPAGPQTSHALSRDEYLSANSTGPTTQESAYDQIEDHVEASHTGSQESQSKRSTIINTTMSVFTRKQPPPHLTLGLPDIDVPATTYTHTRQDSNLNKPLPKSPTPSKLSNLFGWANSPSSSTEFSDKGYSPLPSPLSLKPAAIESDADESPISANSSTYSNDADENSLQYLETYLHTPEAHTPAPSQIQEMEDELKAISAELAASIRREMDLEDLVDKLQDQISNPQAPGKRTSDYFSDSGYSSAKFSEYDHAKEEISQIQRRADQEKAQIRLDLTGKLQDERSRRRQLDQQILELSKKASQIDQAQLSSKDASGRVKELESTCEDLRRKLSDERQVKNNFEDLLAALKGELQSASNERDNLRDEVVPQLRARVEGLEADAADHTKLAYDTSKMQQELQSLKSENTELKQSETRMSTALSRSASVTGGSYKKTPPQTLSRSNTISRSNTMKQTEPREILAERLKDVEAQRDALHSALRNLLERQEFQNRENNKKIQLLEMERDRLLSGSPKKRGYEREAALLRDEITVLRRRAEEAIEQKWQVEKGLGGLKMDLDRAEEEVASLRSLLKENDILIPETLARSSGSSGEFGQPVTSASLEKAYKELQAAHAETLERIKSLQDTAAPDEKTRIAIQRLEQSLEAAVSERDLARTEATAYRVQVESLQLSEKGHLDTECDLASQLRESARRVEELAQQVRSQLATNATLRTRLGDTVARGEAEQRVSTERIAGLQKRLRTLEEQVVAAQTSAEERVTRHEEELAKLKESHNIQLQRLREASSPRLFPPKSPLSPMFSARRSGPTPRSVRMSSPLLSPRVNRLSVRRSVTSSNDGTGGTMAEQVDALKGRVAELEGALAAADAEMQEVVSRMNTAQIAVMTLQEEREDAVRQTRRLQRSLEEEKMRVFEQQFKTITAEVR
ncbi:hypothetical protein B0H66DRAFT_34375 [Apodospora peruviana]|uniref:DUF7603 domain-containing protein n=1 Tax=Apodospora peruviana TaxID=516989 RepID=A0AAE0IR87_9PEZI|nr:hypothetical protein B0H66DRAFT_34375 [Apodospora peruviana]